MTRKITHEVNEFWRWDNYGKIVICTSLTVICAGCLAGAYATRRHPIIAVCFCIIPAFMLYTQVDYIVRRIWWKHCERRELLRKQAAQEELRNTSLPSQTRAVRPSQTKATPRTGGHPANQGKGEIISTRSSQDLTRDQDQTMTVEIWQTVTRLVRIKRGRA